MFKLYQKILTQKPKGFTRLSCLTRFNSFSSSTVPEVKNQSSSSEEEKLLKFDQSIAPIPSNNMVRKAFALINAENRQIHTPSTDEKIDKAISIDELLSISQGSGVSRNHALKVVSLLSNWTTSGKIQLTDFESDPRFIRLCKILTKITGPSKKSQSIITTQKNDDLTTILNIAADDEAAKIVESITLSQMVKVLTALAAKKRRSPLLLRALAFNISASPELLNIKQCADVLFSISSLNFYDENLFDKVANNIITVLETEKITKSTVLGSILTSMGLLKYKNPALLDFISEWVMKNHTICRPQDIFSLFMTMAVTNCIPSNSEAIFKILIPQLTPEEAANPVVWLEIVWSLVLLNQANADHVQSVLNETFLNRLEENSDSLSPSVKLKLLNIDGAARYLIHNYNGPKIPDAHEIKKTIFAVSKEKLDMVNSVIETMKNLISETNLRTRINTGLGFYIDAECQLDQMCSPKPFTSSSDSNLTRIAVLAYDYHDMCKGKIELTGVNELSQRLLTAMGFKVVSVPYTEFKNSVKIVHKVKYLETKLKQAVKV